MIDSPTKKLPGLRIILRRLMATGVGIFQTRLALAGVELEEEMQRLILALVLGLVAVTFSALALIVATLMIVFAVAEEHRVLTMGIIVVVYLVIAALLGLRLKGIFSKRPPIFAATLAEIEKDRSALMAVTEDPADDVKPDSMRRTS